MVSLKKSKYISNPIKASVLISSFFTIFGCISPKNAIGLSSSVLKKTDPDLPGW